MILIALAGSLAVIPIGLLAGSERDAALGGASFIGCAVCLALFHRGQGALASYIFAFVTLAFSAVVLTTGKGIHDIGITLLPLSIVLSNLLYSRQIASIAGWLAATLGSLIALAEALGLSRTELSHLTRPEDALELFIMLGATNLILQRLVQMMDRARAQAAEEERGYREIFNATNDAIFIHDARTGEYLDANDAALRLGSHARERLIGRTFHEILSHEDAEAALNMVQSCRDLGPQMLTWASKTKEGEETVAEVSIQPAYLRGRDVVLAVFRDTSELVEMRERVAQGEKLQVVGQLAGGVAHDFNNQLTGIMANAELLADLTGNDPEAKQAVEAIIRCSNRSADLTAQLLAFARRGKHQNVIVDIHALITEVVSLLERSIDKRIELRLELSPEQKLVRGDPTLLQNALLNLGLNGRDAMPHGGKLIFRTSVLDSRPPPLRPGGEAERAKRVIIEVEDTGQGMDESTRQRVFEPFFSTKRGGNGMGLAAVYGAVESHGGRISVRSRPLEGATFRIELPAAEPPSKHSEGSLPRLPKRNVDLSGLRILLAEDEAPVAEVATRLLRELGCEVSHVADGRAALLALQDGDFDAAVLDHMMPHLSGREVLAAIREDKRSLPCVLTSGYANDAVIDDADSDVVFLPKPFSKGDLATALAHAVGDEQDSVKSSWSGSAPL